MKNYQLEFDFIKEMNRYQSKLGIIDWTVQHVRPDMGWDSHPFEMGNEDSGSFLERVKDHLRIGLSFKWKI